MISETEVQSTTQQAALAHKVSPIDNTATIKTIGETSIASGVQNSAAGSMRPLTMPSDQAIKSKPKKGQMYKVTLPSKSPARLDTHPLSKSHVAFLVSINNKAEMSSLYIQAVLDFLNKANVPEVTIILGGFLRRYNFWQHESYKATSVIPSQGEMEKYALNLETQWLRVNQSTEQYRTLEKKLGKNFRILTWKQFMESANYAEVNKEQRAQFNCDKSYHDDIVTNTKDHLKTSNKHAPIPAKDLEAAEQNSLNFVLEEMPLLSPKVLNVDWLLYNGEMNKPLETAYKFLNGLKSDDELLNQSRWLTLIGKTITANTPNAVPVGYSNLVVNDVTSKGTKTKAQNKQTAVYMPVFSAAAAHNRQNPKIGMGSAYTQPLLMQIQTSLQPENPLIPSPAGFITPPDRSPRSDTKLAHEFNQNAPKMTSKSASNSPLRNKPASPFLSSFLRDLEIQIKEFDEAKAKASRATIESEAVKAKATRVRDTVKQLQQFTAAMITDEAEAEANEDIDNLSTKSTVSSTLVH